MTLSIDYNLWAFWVVVVGVAINVVGVDGSPFEWQEQKCHFDSLRLPERVKPTHYELLLKFGDVEELTTEGQVKINVTVGTMPGSCFSSKFLFNKLMSKMNERRFGCNNKEIILNADERITFGEVKYIVDNGHENGETTEEILHADQICRDFESEMTAIRLSKELRDNSHGQLIIKFTLTTTDSDNLGLYKSVSRKMPKIKSQKTFTTQFEPAGARKAFPCFDEPSLKATFDMIIEHPKSSTALANTLPVKEEPVVESSANTKMVRTRFERTPIMSTYLLAFSVGLYDHLESKIMDEKILLTVFTPKNQTELGQFALDTGRRAYAALHDYFDIEQPINKIDFLPVKMGFGDAMENWGLVTYNDYLLLNEADIDAYDQAYRARVISHELAHYWFGNMVTMKWWDNLWLNEAFANWMSFRIANEIYPELNMNIYFVQDVLVRGLDVDNSIMGTHPIQNDKLKSIKDIEDSFDGITYNKGASVMRMLEEFVGHEPFKMALRDYMSKFKFQNTDEKDLWNSIEARSHAPITEMMNSWIKQAGFPLISVELIANNKIRVRQERFEIFAIFEGKRQLWIIPVNMLVVRDGQQEVVKFILSKRQQEIELPAGFDANKGDWFKLNADFVGFYRVHYDSKTLSWLEKPIRSKQMDVMDRMNMLQDMGALTMIKKVDYASAEDFTSWFEAEDSPTVVWALAGMVGQLRESPHKSNWHSMLVDHYNKVNKQPVKQMQEIQMKKAVTLELIRSNYTPAIDETLEAYKRLPKGVFVTAEQMEALKVTGN